MNEENNTKKGTMIAIIVIALIVVAAAIITPIVLHNMEVSNREEDVATAKEIATTIIKGAQEKADIVVGTPVAATPDTVPGMSEQPFAKGNVVGKGEPFTYYYVKQGNSCAIYIGDDRSFNLSNESQAQQYVNK